MVRVRHGGILHLAAGLLLTVVLFFIASVSVGAAEYSCGAYGASAYDSQVCAASTSSTLENTGQSIWLFVVSAGLIVAGTLLLFRVRKNMKQRVDNQQL